MNLDPGGRFRLQSRSPGYRLVIDGKQVAYCRSPGAALAYLAEKMVSEVDGDVVAGLAAIEVKLDYARRVLDLCESVKIVTRVLARAGETGGDRRAMVAAAALELSGQQSLDVFRKSHQAKEFAELAKAVIDTWRGESEQRREEAAVSTPAAELA